MEKIIFLLNFIVLIDMRIFISIFLLLNVNSLFIILFFICFLKFNNGFVQNRVFL